MKENLPLFLRRTSLKITKRLKLLLIINYLNFIRVFSKEEFLKCLLNRD